MPREECFHVGDYNGPNGTHCLIGWARVAFRGYPEAREKFLDAMNDQIGEDFYVVAAFNDGGSFDRSDADRVEIWDKVARRFGYYRTREDWK